MGGGQRETPARGQAQPGQDGRFATAAGTCTIAQGEGRAKRGGLYRITPEGGEASRAGPDARISGSGMGATA